MLLGGLLHVKVSLSISGKPTRLNKRIDDLKFFVQLRWMMVAESGFVWSICKILMPLLANYSWLVVDEFRLIIVVIFFN